MARIGGMLGIGYAGMYQMLRWVATILFLALLYRMLSRFFAGRLWRQFLVGPLRP